MSRPRRRIARDPSPSQRAYIYYRDGGQCQYCGTLVTRDTMHADHVLPWAAGGPTRIANLVTACSTCNRLKASQVLPADSAPVVAYSYITGRAGAERR